MQLPFTKMHGAGNDFVVLDATTTPFDLSPEQLRRLGDRRFGVGCDQILVVERPAPGDDVDFRYRIFNNDGDEVEHCGNGARCFLRYVTSRGLTAQSVVRVRTVNAVLELALMPDGRVRVDMGPPRLVPESLPFEAGSLRPDPRGLWPLQLVDGVHVDAALISMGNPHAVLFVDDVDSAPVTLLGPQVQADPRFPQGVNVGFLQIQTRARARIRVYERGAGETLACGTGTCAAVVAGIRAGLLDPAVEVQARGGDLRIEWSGQATDSVFLIGPATLVFEGTISL
ncbi:diaminopimelate epimerase [Inhella gelatinilytica]|uniref:Diaminopimelate epimerase n=1 Tax=Inhella gelatinilytica TaxID=2795030 RepID=A0A931IWA0_9BURK|nr:diaminopimelate epimerase [Inhella gelatinilytica]MBH9552194.1 diaminopimelate epimerase [Inhella gelatinilytica]